MDYTLCAVCRKPLAHDGEDWRQPVADHEVWKLGELAYIEIACAEHAQGDPYWTA